MSDIETDDFGYNKEGEFEGYAARQEVYNKMKNWGLNLEGAIKTADEKSQMRMQSAIDNIQALQRNLMKLGENDIKRKKLKYYEDLAETEFKKGEGSYQFELGGIAGFLAKIFKSISGKNED